MKKIHCDVCDRTMTDAIAIPTPMKTSNGKPFCVTVAEGDICKHCLADMLSWNDDRPKEGPA